MLTSILTFWMAAVWQWTILENVTWKFFCITEIGYFQMCNTFSKVPTTQVYGQKPITWRDTKLKWRMPSSLSVPILPTKLLLVPSKAVFNSSSCRHKPNILLKKAISWWAQKPLMCNQNTLPALCEIWATLHLLNFLTLISVKEQSPIEHFGCP